MTNNQAIQWINRLIQTMKSETAGEWPDPSYKDEVYIVLNMAIKALQFKEDYNDGEVWVTISKALYEKCLDAMEQPKIQTWISCNERLPKESDGKVLITINGKVQTGMRSEYGGTWYIGDMCGVGGDDPIAWMPLPKPYEPQESEK